MKVGEYTKWKGVNLCANCHKILSDNQLMYNNGICPLCGNKPVFRSTVADHYVASVRCKKINPTWKFWLRQWEMEIKK